MKEVTRWAASDGKEFAGKAECKEYEAGLIAYAALCTALAESMRTGRIEAVLRHIVVNGIEVRSILAKYSKSLPAWRGNTENKFYAEKAAA